MRVQQLWHWIYVRGVTSFEAMTSVSKELRAALAARHTLARPEVVAEQISADGTRKWLLRLPGEHAGENPHEVECVYIPETDRGTLCLSSQVGCTLNCSFCHTGTQRLVRNLTAGEIVGQIMIARDRLDDWNASAETTRKVSNIVMMGMGEPLYNFEAVRDALLVAQDGDGLGISRRRITLSTSGVVPMIPRAGEEIGVMLAVSLHAVRDELRNELVPLNRKYPIGELLEACRNYPGVSNARRITFEYVMLKGVNNSIADAKELVRLLKGIPAKINLIPFNPWPGTRLRMLGLGADREILASRVRRRLCLAGSHAARPRHPRRLRPAQERDGEAFRARAAGAARHGDDGLSVNADGRACSYHSPRACCRLCRCHGHCGVMSTFANPIFIGYRQVPGPDIYLTLQEWASLARPLLPAVSAVTGLAHAAADYPHLRGSAAAFILVLCVIKRRCWSGLAGHSSAHARAILARPGRRVLGAAVSWLGRSARHRGDGKHGGRNCLLGGRGPERRELGFRCAASAIAELLHRRRLRDIPALAVAIFGQP